MYWNSVHRNWDKWSPSNVGSSGQPLKAALLINYDSTGPSRLLSTIYRHNNSRELVCCKVHEYFKTIWRRRYSYANIILHLGCFV